MNASEDKNMPVLFGCTTTGREWLFFKFENNTFYVDKKPMTDLATVIGTWHWILNYYINTFLKKNLISWQSATTNPIQSLPTITGNSWLFLRLKDGMTVEVDINTYPLQNLETVLGVLQHIINKFK